jgi:D-alanyl-D-alanine carboxypeptidase
VRGVDGIKTGFTNASGFNLVTSAQADGRSIVGVVLGGKSGGARDAQMRALVAKYMPVASRRGGGNLVAETAVSPTVQAAETAATEEVAVVRGGSFNLPDNGPVPGVRYSGETTKSIEVAYASEQKPASDNPVLAEDVEPNTLQAQSREIARAVPVPAAEIDEQVTHSVDKVTTASTPETQPQGWVIQIGATPDKDQAMTLLDNAKDKGGKALRGAQPFTVAFSNGGGQLYRARFAGFSNQNKALSACKVLKGKGFACWASLQ